MVAEGRDARTAEVGKRVAGNAYFHRDALDELPSDLRERVLSAEAFAGATQWNVVKIEEARRTRISFLTYEDFDEPFPALLECLAVDTARGSIVRRSYRGRLNPPVLHRKELLLPSADPRRARFGALTAELERLRLLERGLSIGTRLGWERRLRDAGVVVIDHSVRPDAGWTPPLKIQRHLAALRRDGLSTPIQALLRYGLINAGVSVFDYGCGRGSDVEGLQAAGVSAAGWDPHFAPQAPRTKADIVNLGFVLNVIERPIERVEALRSAFALARTCLAVGVITSSRARLECCRPYGDGYVTRLGTFQKYFQPSELKALIEGVLAHEALPAGPGLFFIFRDPVVEQEFLAARQARRPPSPLVATARRRLAREARLQAIRPELDRLAELAYELGRRPAPEEIPLEILNGLRAAKTPLVVGVQLAESLCDPDFLAQARAARIADLQVYFALNQFNDRVRYTRLPLRLQRDVKAFFGDLAAANEQARALLFSLSAEGLLAQAAAEAAAQGIGWLGDGEKGYWAALRDLARLPAVLRCYAGCAERFAGGLEGADVLKFHLASGKLTALRYSDFQRALLPRLETRTKIDLRAQRIQVFDHFADDQRLLFKSRLMDRHDPDYERQAVFDAQLGKTALKPDGLRAAWGDIVAAARAQRPG